jgi:integrase
MRTTKKSSRQRGVYPRGDTWCIRYEYLGKQRREAIGSYDQAVKAYHARKVQIANGVYEREYGVQAAKKQLPTFKEFATRFLVEYCGAPGRKPALKQSYEIHIQILLPYFGNMRLDQITSWSVRKFKLERSKQRLKSTGKLISPKYVNRSLAALKRMFNVARQWEIMKDNPCFGVEMFPEKQTKAEFLTPEECQRLVNAADAYFRPVLITAIHTGMRRGEILSLTWDQIDLDNRIIRLDEGKTIRTELEYVPIDITLAEALSRLPRQGEYLFMRIKGSGPLKDIRKPFLHALDKSGIAEERHRAGKPRLRFHDLRHTTASLMLMAELPLESVQKMLRHKDMKTTQRYAHLSRDYMHNAASVLDSYISSDTKSDTDVDLSTSTRLADPQKQPYNPRVLHIRPHSSGG